MVSWRGVPVIALILAAVAALMLGPAALAAIEGDARAARAFSQSAGLVAMVAVGLALANAGRSPRVVARAEIVAVLFAFVAAPAAAALPVWIAMPALGPIGAYFEMVSSFTTTGASAIARLEDAPRAVHLWRGLTAWFGGLAALTAAVAVFAPRNLGGYEVEFADRQGGVGRLGLEQNGHGGGDRLEVALLSVGPAYAGLTVALVVGMLATGMEALRAVVTALGVMSTTGLTIDAQGMRGGGGVAVEALAAAFLLVAATRHAFARRVGRDRWARLRRDPELALAGIAVGVAAAWVFLKHWSAVDGLGQGAETLLSAAWGAAFTCLSFLTTAGFVSDAWPGSDSLLGHGYPGMILLGLASIGGGVASTAGGIKLLRIYALYQHGLRDLDLIAHPNAVGRRGEGARRVGFAGAVLAWLFVMLFALGVCVTTLGMAATGLQLDQAVAAAIAAISNTGPAYAAALGPEAAGFAAMTPAARLILCAAMVLGRVEVLAVVALANPDYWRR